MYCSCFVWNLCQGRCFGREITCFPRTSKGSKRKWDLEKNMDYRKLIGNPLFESRNCWLECKDLVIQSRCSFRRNVEGKGLDYMTIDGSAVKNWPANAGHKGSIPGSGRSPGGGSCNPLQYSWLGNPIHRGTWWATVHRVTRVRRGWTTEHACTQIKHKPRKVDILWLDYHTRWVIC